MGEASRYNPIVRSCYRWQLFTKVIHANWLDHFPVNDERIADTLQNLQMRYLQWEIEPAISEVCDIIFPTSHFAISLFYIMNVTVISERCASPSGKSAASIWNRFGFISRLSREEAILPFVKSRNLTRFLDRAGDTEALTRADVGGWANTRAEPCIFHIARAENIDLMCGQEGTEFGSLSYPENLKLIPLCYRSIQCRRKCSTIPP